MLEEKLSQRRKRRMEQLEQRQMEETKVLSGSIYARDGSSASSFLLDASCSPAEGDKFVKQITQPVEVSSFNAWRKLQDLLYEGHIYKCSLRRWVHLERFAKSTSGFVDFFDLVYCYFLRCVPVTELGSALSTDATFSCLCPPRTATTATKSWWKVKISRW